MPVLLFVLYVVAEIAAIATVAHFVGPLWTVLLLIAGSAIGIVVVRAQGRRVMDGFRRASRGEGSPGGAMADGALVALGAALMFVPGLVTSVLGLLLLAPPTRAMLRPVVVAITARRFAAVAAAASAAAASGGAVVVDGEVVEQWYEPDFLAKPQPAVTSRQVDETIYIDEQRY